MKKYFILLVLILTFSSSCSVSESEIEVDCPSISDEKTVVEQPTPTENIPTKHEIYKYLGSDEDVYRININTLNNEFPLSVSTYIDGTLNITEQDTSIIIKDIEKMRIRLRGNSTSEAVKKPFKIKFDNKQSLFGLESAKEWVLLANYFDKTNIRNYLAYKTANKLSNLDFQPSSIFVDVYINNDYQGLYMLCEQIEANKGRVDIEDNLSPTGISSFLLEVDGRALDEYAGYANKCYISLGNYTIAFKYPKASKYVEAVKENNIAFIDEYEKNINWATNYLNNAFDLLKSNVYEVYSEYFDIPSFIDYYLIQEFFKNVDVGYLSQYYVIDQSDEIVKIKSGPVWDFDISAGVIDDSQGSYIFYANEDLFVRENDQFYKLMFNSPIFLSNVRERYKEIRSILIETINEIQQLKVILNKAQSRNIKKWPFPKDKSTWIEVHGMSNTYFNLPSLSHHYTHLENTLRERLLILDKYYLT